MTVEFHVIPGKSTQLEVKNGIVRNGENLNLSLVSAFHIIHSNMDCLELYETIDDIGFEMFLEKPKEGDLIGNEHFEIWLEFANYYGIITHIVCKTQQ